MAVEEDKVLPHRHLMVFLVVVAMALGFGILYDSSQPKFMTIHYTNCYNPEHDPCVMNGTCPPIEEVIEMMKRINLTNLTENHVWFNGSYCEVEWR